MPKPHGGRLINRLLYGDEQREALRRARELAVIQIDEEQAHEAFNIACGVYSPLEGFMGIDDVQHVLHHKRLSNDLPWTIPIVLDVSKEEAIGLKEGNSVVLRHQGKALAILHLEQRYTYDKREFVAEVFGTTDIKHPGVAEAMGMGEVLLGGKLDLIQEPEDAFSRYKLTPRETRILFQEKGWRAVVGFQTRNVPHLGHEYVQKTALSFVDGLFINPVIGRKKRGDFKDEVILDAYDALISHYYPKDRAVLGIWRTEMRYAGPREAIFHAIVRKNFGCTHLIVGRDHAGVGSYYLPYAAQEIFEEFPDLGITPLFVTAFFYCKKCGAVANEKTCPHSPSHRVEFSGTRLREVLSERTPPPIELIRPEVAEAIMKWEHPFVA